MSGTLERFPRLASDRELRLRVEALRMLDGHGQILETARDLSRLFREQGIQAVVIGGVSVVLHGHVRTTVDVDVLADPPLERIAAVLEEAGYMFDREKQEFRRGDIPVHLVLPDRAGPVPVPPDEIDGIFTVSLARLINMKLRSGTQNLLRAQDLADVIGLLRRHALDGEFVRHIDRDLRAEFRRLVRAIRLEQAGR